MPIHKLSLLSKVALAAVVALPLSVGAALAEDDRGEGKDNGNHYGEREGGAPEINASGMLPALALFGTFALLLDGRYRRRRDQA